MSERYGGEEEPRRRSGRRRSSDPYADDEVRRRSEPSFDEERHGEGEARVRRSGPRAGGLSGIFDRVAGRLMERGSGRRRRRGGTGLQQMQGLYGSDTGSNVLGSAVAELIGTFILVFTGCAVAVAAILQRSTAGPAFYDSLAVGFALACGVFIAGPITGGSLNPARTLGPMIVAGQFGAVWG